MLKVIGAGLLFVLVIALLLGAVGGVYLLMGWGVQVVWNALLPNHQIGYWIAVLGTFLVSVVLGRGAPLKITYNSTKRSPREW